MVILLLVAFISNQLKKITGISSDTWVSGFISIIGAIFGAYIAVYEALRTQRLINKEEKEKLDNVISTSMMILDDYFALTFNNLMNKYNKKTDTL
jgi:hypothetical protein